MSSKAMLNESQTILSAARIRAAIVGAIVLTLFGGLWWIVTLAYWSARPGWAIPVAFAITVVLLMLCIVRFWASRKIQIFDDPAVLANRRRAGIFSGIIFGIEGALIGLSSRLLAHHRLGVWIPMAIAIIVGLHFLPLARIWKMPIYYLPGILSILGVLGCLLIRDVGTRLLCVGLVMTSVLWLSAVLLLLQTRSVQPARL
jgi:Family of unknown function (DUF7010)